MALKYKHFLLLLPLLQNMTKGASLDTTTPSPKQGDDSDGVCGGEVVGSGEIRYKVGQATGPNELCVWTLINPQHPFLSVDLTAENFADDGDHVEIFYYLNGSLHNPVPAGSPHCEGPILSNRGQRCLVPGSLIYLVFRSNAGLHGTGFSIKIQPLGEIDPPSGTVWEPVTLPHREIGGWVDYQGGFKSGKVISWSLVHPREFVLYRFNISSSCSTNPTTPAPSLTIFQANKGSPTKLERVCGRIQKPIQLVQGPILGSSPFLIIYENGRRTYPGVGGGEIKFYWNLDEPPPGWVPEKGGATARRSGCGSVTGFLSGMVILLAIYSHAKNAK